MNVGREVHGGSILNLHEKQKPPRELPHDGFRFSSHNMVGEMRLLDHYYGVEVNGARTKFPASVNAVPAASLSRHRKG